MKNTQFSSIVRVLVCALPLFLSQGSYGQVINTYAGNGTAGYTADGVYANTTAINSPWGVAIDRFGNIYIGDSPNNRVRKVNTSGIISTFAGDGTSGFSGDGGQATAARLFNPSGVAVDWAGNVYIADNGNNRVRKVATTGIITTIAGTGSTSYGGDGGPATAATLVPPDGIGADSAGNVYVSSAYAVRKISIAGTIDRIAGDGVNIGNSGDGGPATAALIGQSSDIRVDKAGNVVFTDYYNHCVRKIDAAGIITTIAGNSVPGFGGDGGPATAGLLSSPVGVDIDDAGYVYIGDRDNARIRKVSPSGIITTIAGDGANAYYGDGGHPLLAALRKPHAITHDPCGSIYYCDRLSNRIRVIQDLSIPFAGVVVGIDSVCPGDSVQLTDSVPGGVWSVTNTTVANISPTGYVTGIVAGYDTVRYTVTYFCGTKSAEKVIKVRSAASCSTTSVGAVGQPVGSSVYPNPSDGSFIVTVRAAMTGDAHVVITNMVGQQVQAMNIPVNKASAVKIDVPAGVYALTITAGANSYVHRVVVR